MKLLLINLSLRPESSRFIFPIGLGYIATAIKEAEYDFDLLDVDLYKYDIKDLEPRLKGYDVIAFGCIVTGYRYVKELSHLIHKVNPKAVQICGNTVASSVSDTLLANTKIDIIVCGEGDNIILDILKHLTPGIYRALPVKNIDQFRIDWEIFEVERYIAKSPDYVNDPYPMPKEKIRAMPINTARGCIAKCTFCYHAFYGIPYRYHSIDKLAQEINIIRGKYKINYVTFYDDLTLFSKKRASEFADMMKEKGLYWTANCRANLFTHKDIDLVNRMRDSGCLSLGYSLESANATILKAMKKKISLDNFAEQKRVLDEAGIATVNSLVIGYPQETEETLQETFDFCYEIDNYPSVGYLLPQPGTPVYWWARKDGYIKDEEEYLLSMGDRQDLRINMSQIPWQRLEQLVHGHLKRISDKLKLNLSEEKLIKTGRIRIK